MRCGSMWGISQSPVDYFLILSGDQLYNMDFRKVIDQHIKNEAELTVATIRWIVRRHPVSASCR